MGNKSKNSKTICKFCGQEKKLIDAHIIPKNFYLERKKLQYEKYFLNPLHAHIIETPEVSQRINKEFNTRMLELYKKGFVPPKPPGV